ncbi:MAG: hypothetical protein FJ125_03820 [Deltaproteobacteria bacterium]|nr:hypothetical protein [Deltaproteobacteria bacterium]
MGRRYGEDAEDREELDDGERLSWREIDHLRDHPEERDQLGAERKGKKGRAATGTTSMRAQLSQAFDGGDIVTKLEERRSKKGPPPDPDANEPPTRAAMIRKIRAATESRLRHEALDAMLAIGERLPDDTSLLASLVDHPREDLVRQILLHLEELLGRQPLKHKASFVMRLETLKLTAEQSATFDVADRLLDRLR